MKCKRNKCGNRKINFIVEYIFTWIFIAAYILLVIQLIINYNFIKNKTREIVAEKLLYEHFSDEIFSNIKSYPFKKITAINDTDDNDNFLELELKLDTYFDCQGEKSGLLNEKYCQNQIVDNLTCCESECCQRVNEEIICNNYNFNIKRAFLEPNILTYNDEERLEDPRRRFCKYYNKYSGSTNKVLNYTLIMEKYNYNYYDLLLKKNEDDTIFIGDTPPEGFIDCGELDTLKNHLYVKNNVCPVNFALRYEDNLYFDSLPSTPLPIFIRNILSEIPPHIHEWKNRNVDESNQNKKFPNITIKDIDKIIKNENDNYYRKQDIYLYINELPDYSDIYHEKVNIYQKLYWYTTKYIGFKSSDELEKFETIFQEDDPKNNPLYKFRTFMDANGILFYIIILFIFIGYLLVYFIIFIKIFRKIEPLAKNVLFYIKEIIIVISFLVGLIIYIAYTKIRFKSIKIDMDEHYKKILSLYNKRRKQIYFLIGVILMGVVILYEIYFFFFAEREMNYINNDDLGSEVSNNIHKGENNPQVNREEQNNRNSKNNIRNKHIREVSAFQIQPSTTRPLKNEKSISSSHNKSQKLILKENERNGRIESITNSYNYHQIPNKNIDNQINNQSNKNMNSSNVEKENNNKNNNNKNIIDDSNSVVDKESNNNN